jgi:UDP:flavonoid glycosyltransferase YjiC (YdhE family)
MACNDCSSCYPLCDLVISCAQVVFVTVPPAFTGETINLRLVNGRNHVAIIPGLFVTSGVVEFNAVDELPEAFLNPYGGPFTLQFFDPVLLNPIDFTAKDAKPYSCVTFHVEQTTGSDTTDAIINAFNDTIATPY